MNKHFKNIKEYFKKQPLEYYLFVLPWILIFGFLVGLTVILAASNFYEASWEMKLMSLVGVWMTFSAMYLVGKDF